MASWTWHVKRTLGAALAHYEAVALLVDDNQVVPKYTTWCHPNQHGSTIENRARLALAVASATWVAVHLMRPWVRQLLLDGGADHDT